MNPLEVLLGMAVLLVSVLLTAVARRVFLAHGMVDLPNARSSHSTPTPRGGGIAIVIASISGLAALAALNRIDGGLLAAMAVGGLAVAGVGLADDRYQLPASARFIVHLCAAVWAVRCLGGLAPIAFGERNVELHWVGDALAVVALVAAINIFNFMDGIDGLAASEATFIAVAVLAFGAGAHGSAGAALVFAAACGGFLVWNWPPARIFMGDVGSGFIGFAVGVLIIAAARQQAAAPFVGMILGGVFIVDATVTLLRRLVRGERLHQAHRTHAYQWLARRWNSHRYVTLAMLAVNVSWLLPAAALASRHPRFAAWLVLAAWLPLIVGVVWAGAGRREGSAESGVGPLTR